MNQIVNMIVRQVVRRLVMFGITKGVDVASKRRAGNVELTPEQKSKAGVTSKRAKQALRIARRMGR